MLTLISEQDVVKTVKHLLGNSSDSHLAVAFWGAGAAAALDLAGAGPMKIICNLQSGCCNPDEIRKIQDLPNVSLRTHDSLHAKVYLAKTKALVGSSNASTNGMCLEGAQSGWREANLLTDDLSLLKALRDRLRMRSMADPA